MSHHLTSPAPLSKWQNPSWIHWHLIIKHRFNMVYTSFGMLILSSKWFWNIFEDFGASFGDSNKKRTTTSKLQTLCQGSCPISMYIYEFRQLACDISWDEVVFMSQFQFGLCGDVEDLLLTMFDPTTLNQAIAQVMRYDNWLFKLQ